MGREIRRVPANWKHPKDERGRDYQPLHDRSFREAAQRWKAEFAAWERGERPDYCSDYSATLEFWEWDGDPPDRKYYRPDWPEGSATHFQVYETVSEGTPVTPHFSTKAKLIDYLVENGDFWDQERGHGGWSRDNAEAFVGREWAPSLMVMGGTIKAPRDGA